MGYCTDFDGRIEILTPEYYIPSAYKALIANSPLDVFATMPIASGKTIIDDLSPLQALAYIKLMNRSRRMKRNVSSYYGVEGEWYVNIDDLEHFGQTRTDDIINYNSEPSPQPGLWMGIDIQYDENTDKLYLTLDDGKNYYYVEWLEYIIENVLIPKDIILNGVIKYWGEEEGDVGKVIVNDNVVSTTGNY